MRISPRHIAIGIVAFTGLAIIGLAVWRLSAPKDPHVDVDRSVYPVLGIDISAHNGPVDFRRVKEQGGVSFVYLKATEGTDFRDSCFISNYEAARKAGLKVGPYHFFRFDTDGAAQARNLISTLNGRLFDLPVAIDVEEWGNPAQVPTETIVARLEALRAYLAAAGIPSLIYTNKTGYFRFVHRRLDTDLWLCSFTSPPAPAAVHWTFWQHSHRGNVPGVRGRVDLNTFNGDSAKFEEWLIAAQ